MDKEKLAEEVNDIGPITEHVFESKRLLTNLKSFMRSEGYPEEQVKRIVTECHEGELQKMRKLAMRWKQLSVPNGKLVLKALDHWKMINGMRKLFKYWMNFSNNRVQYVQADMQDAFQKWRQGDLS